MYVNWYLELWSYWVYSCEKVWILFDLTDGYTTNDIIYEWGPTGVVVGNNEMAQFEYKNNNLSSSIDEFSTGK